MKKYILLLILSFGFNLNLKAQVKTCDCKSDLIFINKKIEKLPSYKNNKTAYNEAYNSILAEITTETPYYECFLILNKLFIPLNDWHMGIIEKSTDSLSVSPVNYPSYSDNLINLNNYLRDINNDEIEGIYHIKKELSYGIVYNKNNKVYDAVVLSSKSSNWNKGDILYKLMPLQDNFFKVLGAQYPTKRLISYHERINKGIFLRAGFVKDTLSNFYFRNPYSEKVFVYKEISTEIDYIKVGSFNANYPLLKEAEQFYKSLEGKLVKPHLILDLRDNGGGGDRNSDILLKQLKKYVKINIIHIITNARTGSNAEQFTIKLNKYNNVISYGDKTRGALSYEIKPDDYHTLPSSDFLVILPSKVHKEYLEYETKGFSPDYLLDYKQNWISIIVNKIESKY